MLGLAGFAHEAMLGQGTFGAVHAYRGLGGQRIAVKQTDVASYTHEVGALQRVHSHPHVIALHAHATMPDGHAYLALEAGTGSDLLEVLLNAGSLAGPMWRYYLRQMVDGLVHCHQSGVAHLDVKLENYLIVNVGGAPVIKLIDFGLSHLLPALPAQQPSVAGALLPAAPPAAYDYGEMVTHVRGSPAYAAPELLARAPYNPCIADAWSLGVCAFAMALGFFPVEQATANDLRFNHIVAAQQAGSSAVLTLQSLYHRNGIVRGPMQHLIDSLLKVRPEDRAPLEAVAAAPFLTGGPLPAAPPADPIFRSTLADDPPVDEIEMLEVEEMVQDAAGPFYRPLGSLDDEASPPLPQYRSAKAPPPVAPVPYLRRQRNLGCDDEGTQV